MGKVKAILAVVAVVLVGALIVFNASNPTTAEVAAWNPAMAKGNRETGKHYIMYTDIFCPYCDKFSNAMHANIGEFTTDYIDSGKVYYEVRVTDINYRSGHSENSRPGGEAIYCAAQQGKFWEYYRGILDKLYADYHSKGIGVSRTSEEIPVLENEYFYGVGETAGLDASVFRDCMEGHKSLEELNSATEKASRLIASGVPYFVFGKYKASGFDGNWDTANDWRQVRLMLEAGLQ